MTEKVSTPKKGKSTPKAKKPKTTPSHPKVSDMVDSAIKELKERGGSSLHSIKKYIASNYKADAEKLAPFIRKYLKSSVVNGGLVQVKGKGANGSFRIGGDKTSGAVKKASHSKKAKKTAAKTKAANPASTVKKAAKPKKTPRKSKPKTTAAKKPKPVVKIAAKKTKPAKTAAKKKPAKKASPKKKPAAKKAKAKK